MHLDPTLPPAPTTDAVQWAGFHHIALVTPDLETTIAFYRDVLGMHAGEVLVGGGVIPARHCFVRPGASTAAWGLHFFEQPGVALPQYPGGLSELRAAGYIPGALQHIAFALPSAAAADPLRERLAAHGVETTPTGTIGPIQNLLFFDRHGLLLEATWPRPGASAQPSEAA